MKGGVFYVGLKAYFFLGLFSLAFFSKIAYAIGYENNY